MNAIFTHVLAYLAGCATVGAWWWWINNRAKARALAAAAQTAVKGVEQGLGIGQKKGS